MEPRPNHGRRRRWGRLLLLLVLLTLFYLLVSRGLRPSPELPPPAPSASP